MKAAASWAGIAVAGLLCLRGATAFYVQFTQPGASQMERMPATGSQAPSSKAERLARATALVAGMGRQGRVVDVFGGQDGSTGVIIQSGEGAFIGWMVDGVPALFVGAKFDARGQNVTQDETLARRLAVPSNAPATSPVAVPVASQTRGAVEADVQGLMRAVGESAGFVEGAAGPIWTAYVDGNCAFCTQLWRSLRAPIANGQIRVRWAPVAMLGGTSAGKAATLLQSARPADVLAAHGVSGAAIVVSPVAAQSLLQIEANTAMLRTLSGGQAPATPTLVVPRASGGPMIVRGLPADIPGLLKQAGS